MDDKRGPRESWATKRESWATIPKTALAQSLRIIQIRRQPTITTGESRRISRTAPTRTRKSDFISKEDVESLRDTASRATSISERGQSIPPPGPVMIFGMRRRMFYSFVGLSVVLFILSIVIGLVVLSSMKQSIPSFAGLATSGLFVNNNTQWNMNVFFQDPSTNQFKYRISTNTVSFSPSAPISLNQLPQQNVSMAATSFVSADGTTFHQVFYIMDGNIMLVNLTCPSTTSLSCSTLSNNIISKGISPSVAKDSTLAAVFLGLGPTKGWRVFYHNSRHEVTQLTNMNSAWDPLGTIIGGKAVRGSHLAAVTFAASGFIEVLYIDANTNNLFGVEFFNGQWLSPSSLTPSPPSTLSPTSALSISYASTPDTFHAIYVGTDTQLYDFSALSVSSTQFSTAKSSKTTGRQTAGWQDTPEKLQTLAGAQRGGGAASLGWSDQVRVFERVGTGLVMGGLNTSSGVWTASVRV